MTTVETQAGESFVGLNHAESQLPERVVAVANRSREIGPLVLIGVVQLVWFGTFAYFAWVFLHS